MKKYQPKKIKVMLTKLEESYQESLESYVNEIMECKIKPYLIKNELSFTVMNGFPHVYNLEGVRVETPKIILDLWYEFSDIQGQPIGYWLNDFKYSEIDFNECDIKAFKEKVSKMSENECALSMIMTGI